jgi:hypothetical protein
MAIAKRSLVVGENHFPLTISSWRAIVSGVLFFLVFFSFYFYISETFARAGFFNKNNLLFEIDASRGVGDMTVFDAYHYRTTVHPLYVLLVNPVGISLQHFFSSPDDTAAFMTSIFGALGVLLSFVLFYCYSQKLFPSLMLAGLFGFSSSQIFLSTTPDTSSLAICSVITTYILFYLSLRSQKCRPAVWILAGLFSFSITITNFVQTLICFLICSYLNQSGKKIIRTLGQGMVFALTVVIIAGMLAVLQKAIYPSTIHFIFFRQFKEETHYASFLIFQQPLTVLWELFKAFFVINVVAPIPNTIDANLAIPYFSFAKFRGYFPLGWLALAVWLPCLALGVYASLRERKNTVFLIGVLCCLGFNGVLHSVYGMLPQKIELLLYTGNFTCLVLLLASGFLLSNRTAVKIGLGALVVLTAANNLMVLNHIFVLKQEFHTLSQPFIPPLAVNSTLQEYRTQLNHLRQQVTENYSIPDEKFFLFGMGNRRKMIYQQGTLKDSFSGEIIGQWQVADEVINPPAYQVVLKTFSDGYVKIEENETGVWLSENGKITLLSGGYVNLPTFENNPDGAVLRVLHQEILVNIVDGKPLPNYFVYYRPFYRDAAMMCMVLKQTGNLGLVRDWILGLDQPFDLSNGGGEEPDNLGEVLYMISLVSDSSHPLVKTIQDILPKYTQDHHLVGLTDAMPHPVYQTAWLKFGLDSLGLPDPYIVPDMPDSYASLTWWARLPQGMSEAEPIMDQNFPYLAWAGRHSSRTSAGYLANQDYPLSWESDAGFAKYKKIAPLSAQYVDRRISAPHSWTAAEMFLSLIDVSP